ncbi:MAG: hypothetical protein MI745_08700 [Pseudomonadales bacterium]|nr:hypothetical protein [Pseudomonadales bacterium]
MAATSSNLHRARELPSNTPLTGTVRYRAGTPGLIDDATGMDLSIDLIGESVTLLGEGDRVLYLLAPGQGIIVTDRLVAADSLTHAPLIDELDDGRLRFDAPQGLILQAGQARVELRADGTVLLDGREIQAVADGLNRLLGARIELN